MIDTQAIRERWNAVVSKLDERGRQVFAAGQVRPAGWRGLKAVSRITWLARSTINRGLPALDPEAPLQDLDATPVSGFSEQPRLAGPAPGRRS